MNRRKFLQGGAIAACGGFAAVASPLIRGQISDEVVPESRIIDAHIHLFDPTRVGGVPWPVPGDSIYRPTLPVSYEKIAQPLGIVGAIAIEASPLLPDNDWLLKVAASSNFVVGIIGDLSPTTDSFAAELARLKKSTLFLGIREGNLWNRSLTKDLESPRFWTSMRELSQAGLVFESANPDLPLLEALAVIVERMPELTIVIDHLPHMREPDGHQDKRRVARLLERLGSAPHCFAKLSEIPDGIGGRPQLDLAPYLARLEQLWESFGPDKLIFGSDWPNSDHIAGFEGILGQVRRYMATKDPGTWANVFFSNSKRAYKWHARATNQSVAPTV